jgi:hydroxyacylglutathione hydrolase
MSYKKITVREAKVKFENELVFIDIREEEERDDGFIPGSSWIPISELNGRMDELPEDEEAIVYCKNGERSAYVLNILFNLGYNKLIQLEEGIDGWKKEGLPIDS